MNNGKKQIEFCATFALRLIFDFIVHAFAMHTKCNYTSNEIKKRGFFQLQCDQNAYWQMEYDPIKQDSASERTKEQRF